jgi:AcrR family transcriptional regulator
MADSAPPGLRRDAARNRKKVLDAARNAIAEGKALSFNELARAADVGVGTVYRHFASVETLRSELVAEALEDLLAVGREAGTLSEPMEALTRFLRSALAAQLRDDALAQVIESRTADARTQTAISELETIFTTLLTAASASGGIGPGVSVGDVVAMLCGVSHTARLYPQAESEAAALRFLDVVIAGLRPPAT